MKESKDHILEKTFYLLLAKGYDGVSISDIQKETGLSRGLLYHYYGSKQQLFSTACEKFLAELFIVEVPNGSQYGLYDMIRFVVDRYKEIYSTWDNYPGADKITIANYDFLIYRMIAEDEMIAKQYNAMRKKEFEIWQQAANVSIERKEIKSILSAAKIANLFIILLDGIWLQAVEVGSTNQHIAQTKSTLTDYYELLKRPSSGSSIYTTSFHL